MAGAEHMVTDPAGAGLGSKGSGGEGHAGTRGRFPAGLQLVCGDGAGLEVRTVSGPMRVFVGDWLVRGPYLYAWVAEPSDSPDAV